MRRRYDLIIFDCDGTLVESESTTARELSKILIEMGFPQCTYEFCYSNFASFSFEKNIQFLQMELGHKFNAKAFYIAASKAILNNIKSNLKIMPGAIELLESLGNYPRCVASNGRKEHVMGSLVKTKLIDFFHEDHVFSYQQAGMPKPAPDLFFYAAKQMGWILPERCLVIEDSDTGVAAANAADMDVIVVRSPHNPRQKNLKSLEVKAFVEDLREIAKYI